MENKQNLLYRPTIPQDRNTQIDILRGFALFGVLLVNVFGYNSSFFDFSGFYQAFSDSLNTHIFQLLIAYAADKFIFIFSFLFGIGFAIMYSKYQNNENYFLGLYTRRLLALMVFGIIHIVFFWSGDILFTYSLLGMILLLSRKLSPKITLPLAIFLYSFPVIYIAIQSIYPSLPSALNSDSNIEMTKVISIYSQGSYRDIMTLRLYEFWAFRNINTIYYAPKVLSIFFFGKLFYQQRLLRIINTSPKIYLSLAVLLITVGNFLNTYTDAVVDNIAQSDSNPFYLAIYMGVYELTNLFLSFGYILIVLVLSRTKYIKNLLGPLKYIGRMALSNYLLQSLIFTTVMYSYGGGRFGSFEPRELVIMAVIVFIIQVFISRLWLRYFKYGPMEFLWRKLTYRT